MNTTSTRSQIESTLQAIKNRDIAYNELAERFGSLFEVTDQIQTDLISAEIQSLDIDPSSLEAGVPLLAGADLAPWANAFKQSADTLLPVLARVLQLEQEPYRELLAYMENTETILKLAQARIDGDLKLFDTASEQLGITPLTLVPYIVDAVCAPVLYSQTSKLSAPLSSHTWAYGYCPVCGSTPSISQLCLPDTSDSEYLVGGGGKKFLHCSLCGHDWHYKRNACASCGNDDSESREILFLDDVQYERIEACHKCGKYILNVDMREYAILPHLDTMQMGLIHLDLLAHERQLSPISHTLWNTIN